MNHPYHTSKHASGCTPALEEALTLYADGELPADQQPRLFAHLAVCEHCRHTFEGVMTFRRIAREENLNVPPGVDDAFFKRLAAHKSVTEPAPRAPERAPTWRRSATRSVRTVASFALGMFILGLIAPLSMSPAEEPALMAVRGEEELVELDKEMMVAEPATVYVFYPGLTVEAPKDNGAAESL